MPSGRRSSVAEHWRLKPEALGSIPGGATFPFKPMPFQRSTDVAAPIVSLIGTITIGLRTTEESCPSDSSQLCARLVIPHIIKNAVYKWLMARAEQQICHYYLHNNMRLLTLITYTLGSAVRGYINVSAAAAPARGRYPAKFLS